MLSLLVFSIFLISTGLCADHDTFKNCSRVPFCSTLRGRAPTDKYSVDPASVLVSNETGILQLTLTPNDGTKNLQLSLSSLAGDTFRIKIQEVESKRYDLGDIVLGEEPLITKFDTTGQSDNTVFVTVGTNKITITYSPFVLEFSQNDSIEVVLHGNKLTFESNLDQVYAFGVSFPKAVQLYGIHEHADSLALETTYIGGPDPYRLRNLDVAGYELESPMSLYGAIPVLYGHGPLATSGVFLHNAAEQWVEVTNSANATEAYFMVESGGFDLFLLPGPSPVEVVRQYVSLTGTAHLPQLWALGYHQSRWSYMSQDEVKEVATNFNNYNFPLDVMWLDIDYTDEKKYFTWDSNTFGDPEEMQQNLSATHKRLVTIIDPHIKVETGYNVYDGALAKDLFVKNSNGSNFQGDCWPGLSSYMDFLNPEARSYYGSYYHYDNFPHSTPVLGGIWNDMNEPSVFDNSFEKTLPGDAVHYGGVAHRDIHNIYGLLHTMATHQGLMERDNATKRPFILTRSHFSGTQRYAAIWTGDNTADWGYLTVSYSECLDSNLLGIVFCGADVGGFFNDPDEELLQRWYQAGAWLPFYRGHSAQGTTRREPYLYGEDVQSVIRNAIELRYMHLPLWYTLFYEHTLNKDPIIRPLFYHYPADENVYTISNHLLVGQDVLVRAVAEPGVQSVQVYFPGGSEEHWISLDNNQVYAGEGFVDVPVDIQGIPVYYKRGSVIVRQDTIKLSTDEMKDSPYSLHANFDENNIASGTLYMDDYTSFNYITKNEFAYLKIVMENTTVTFTNQNENASSDKFVLRIEQIVINKVTTPPQNGKPGTYEKIVYKKDINGNLLSDLTFTTKTVSIQL